MDGFAAGAAWALALVLLAAAAVCDLAYRRVPNWVPALLAADGMAIRIADGTWPVAAVAGVLVFVVCAVVWRFGWMGGGDVKMLGACAVLVAPMPYLVGAAMVAGGGLAVVYLLLRRMVAAPSPVRPAALWRRVVRAERRRIRRGHALPYCCAIVLGALLTLVAGG